MKTIVGLLLFMILPFSGFCQTADTNTARVVTQDPQVTPVPDMFKNYSAEDKKVFDNLGPNTIMKVEDYDRKYGQSVEQPVTSEKDPK